MFPARVRDLASHPVLHNAPDEAVRIGSLVVESRLILHPGPTVGYRISEGDRSLAYLPDHEPALGAKGFPGAARWTSGAALAAGVDVLIHDAQYTDEERAVRVGWGHSTLGQAAAFAALVGAGRLVTFHHDPSHSDDALDKFHRQIAESTSTIVEPGREGLVLQV